MNTSGEVADLMVKEGIQITESAAKLAGLGAKNLAAIIMALLADEKKLQGKTTLKTLLKEEKPLCILQIKEKDLKTFHKEARKYGILFTPVTDKTDKSGFCDIIARQDDVAKLNYVIEKLGYNRPDYIVTEEKKDEKTSEQTPDKTKKSDTENKSKEQQEDKSKNRNPRQRENQSERESRMRGEKDGNSRRSVKVRVENIKRTQNEKAAKSKQRIKVKNKDRGRG